MEKGHQQKNQQTKAVNRAIKQASREESSDQALLNLIFALIAITDESTCQIVDYLLILIICNSTCV
jgi:hypothetical protein